METVPVPAVLRRLRTKIQSLDVVGQTTRFFSDSWEVKVPFREVSDLAAIFGDGMISRRDIFALGDKAREGDAADRRRLLIATMMWGYGPRGGRSYTNARRALQAPDIDRRLAACADALMRAEIRSAYTAIDGLSGYSEGYFTKFLYFMARNASWALMSSSLLSSTLVSTGRFSSYIVPSG